MHIKMISSLAGADYSIAPGEVTDRFGKKEARRLIAAGLAEEYTPPLPPIDPDKAVANALADYEAQHSAAIDALKADAEKAKADALAAAEAEMASRLQQIEAEHKTAMDKAVADAVAEALAKAGQGA